MPLWFFGLYYSTLSFVGVLKLSVLIKGVFPYYSTLSFVGVLKPQEAILLHKTDYSTLSFVGVLKQGFLN